MRIPVCNNSCSSLPTGSKHTYFPIQVPSGQHNIHECHGNIEGHVSIQYCKGILSLLTKKAIALRPQTSFSVSVISKTRGMNPHKQWLRITCMTRYQNKKDSQYSIRQVIL